MPWSAGLPVPSGMRGPSGPPGTASSAPTSATTSSAGREALATVHVLRIRFAHLDPADHRATNPDRTGGVTAYLGGSDRHPDRTGGVTAHPGGSAHHPARGGGLTVPAGGSDRHPDRKRESVCTHGAPVSLPSRRAPATSEGPARSRIREFDGAGSRRNAAHSGLQQRRAEMRSIMSPGTSAEGEAVDDVPMPIRPADGSRSDQNDPAQSQPSARVRGPRGPANRGTVSSQFQSGLPQIA